MLKWLSIFYCSITTYFRKGKNISFFGVVALTLLDVKGGIYPVIYIYMERLNRRLKNMLMHMGANVTDKNNDKQSGKVSCSCSPCV